MGETGNLLHNEKPNEFPFCADQDGSGQELRSIGRDGLGQSNMSHRF